MTPMSARVRLLFCAKDGEQANEGLPIPKHDKARTTVGVYWTVWGWEGLDDTMTNGIRMTRCVTRRLLRLVIATVMRLPRAGREMERIRCVCRRASSSYAASASRCSVMCPKKKAKENPHNEAQRLGS